MCKSALIVDLILVSVLGRVEIYEMINVQGQRIDQINFNAIDIRNFGTLVTHNGRAQRILQGRHLRVYPGGRLQGTNLLLNFEDVTVDVMGVIEADYRGHNPGGMYHSLYGT